MFFTINILREGWSYQIGWSSKEGRGGGHFQSKKLCCRFWTITKGFFRKFCEKRSIQFSEKGEAKADWNYQDQHRNFNRHQILIIHMCDLNWFFSFFIFPHLRSTCSRSWGGPPVPPIFSRYFHTAPRVGRPGSLLPIYFLTCVSSPLPFPPHYFDTLSDQGSDVKLNEKEASATS